MPSTTFVISGTSMSLRPISQAWEYPVLGDNFDGTKAYSRKKNVLLEFSDCKVSDFKEWEDKATGGSVTTVDILGPDSLTFTQYGPVVMNLESRPKVQSVVVTGTWTIRISEIIQA